MPLDLRQIFEMSFEEGLQNVEIARRLTLSPETIKKRKARLISYLRRAFCHNSILLMMFCQST